MEVLKKNIQDWAVREKFHFEEKHVGLGRAGEVSLCKDKDRVLYRCRDNQCQWGLRGNHIEEGDIQITVLDSEHSCFAPLASQSVASNHEWLQVELQTCTCHLY